MEHVYIVAEIGCNHNGDPARAKEMVRVAKECGVDAVKFQTFNSKLLISEFAPKAEYQIKNTGAEESQLEMTRKLELSHEDYLELKAYAESLGLDVFSTPFDEESVAFLAQQGQRVWKIPSGEITNLPMLRQIAALPIAHKVMLLSTGMSTMEEIHRAVEILNTGDSEVIILHCNTEYPTMDEDVNVSAIQDMQREFSAYEIGFSDHSVGHVAPIMAIAYGVHFIEKHFTLDRNLPGPDHKASIMPDELKMLCTMARRAERMLGCGKKQVTASERKNMFIARKSIVAKKPITKNEVFTKDNITCKRPGNGISPIYFDDVLGKKALMDFQADELIICPEFDWQENAKK